MGSIKGHSARLDVVMVERGLAASRESASELIRESQVLVNGSVALKAARQVRAGDRIEILSPPRYVSRGGFKLEGALTRFGIKIAGLRVLDVGSSTGGFTDCLLQQGARQIFAVDVGTNQLHEKIRQDPRVMSFEQTNIKNFTDPEGLGFDLVVADVSFTSVALLARHLVELTKPDGELVILVKPQFEVGHKDASRGKGIIKDPLLWKSSLINVADQFAREDARILGIAVSPIRGTQGNVEFFFHLSRGGKGLAQSDIKEAIDGEIARALVGSRGESV